MIDTDVLFQSILVLGEQLTLLCAASSAESLHLLHWSHLETIVQLFQSMPTRGIGRLLMPETVKPMGQMDYQIGDSHELSLQSGVPCACHTLQ